jgi:D-alanyl-D-alanine carboxypeptidase
MLMNHSSGIADISQPQVDRHCADPHHFVSPEELIQIGAALPRGAVRPPGMVSLYSSVNTIILGRILEKVTNESYASLMRERLLKPLGLDRTKLDTDGSLEPPFFRLFPGCCASELEA